MTKAIPQTAFRQHHMTAREFDEFSRFIYDLVGIKLPPSKKMMVEGRLQKRVRDLGFKDMHGYVVHVMSRNEGGKELSNLIDEITTNTTDFFREPHHFEYLETVLLPRWRAANPRTRLRLWSAGCSIGMEPYTLAMVLSEFSQQVQGFDFQILATDISTKALKQAVNGVYEEHRIHAVPRHLKVRYLMRSKDRVKCLVRVVPELRNKIDFQQLNFMESFSLPQQQHIIFCRNVVIYFDKPTQLELFHKFCRNLVPGGYLFVGHSESLSGLDLPLRPVSPTVYERV